jgi:hypothetical protein
MASTQDAHLHVVLGGHLHEPSMRQLASRQASDDEAYMSLGIVLHRLAFLRLTVVVLVTPMRGSRTDERQ